MDMTPEKIAQIKRASLVPISLNQTVNEDDKRTVEETLIDDYTENPGDATGKVLLKEDLVSISHLQHSASLSAHTRLTLSFLSLGGAGERGE
jgi:DNA-directed RNA polymerase sigma subunit (sigma70/sigma32)